MRATRIALAAAALGLAAAAPASADSIAFVKGGDLFLGTTDGSYATQVTRTGDYTRVSQDDAGRLAGLTTGGHVRIVERDGRVSSDVDTPAGRPSETTIYKRFLGPTDLDVAPDGGRVAYGFDAEYADGQATYGLGVTRASAFTPFTDNLGYSAYEGYDGPEWIDGTQALAAHGGSTSYYTQVAVFRPDGHPSHEWFNDPQNPVLQDAAFARGTKRTMAFVSGEDRRLVQVYRADGVLGQVWRCFGYEPFADDPATARLSSPTLSADGRRLVYADGRGLVTVALPDMGSGCGTPVDGRRVLPGASSPDWGPTDAPGAPVKQPDTQQQPAQPQPPVARQVPVTPVQPRPAPVPSPPAGPAVEPLSVAGPSRTTVAKLRKGVVLRVRVGGAGAVRAKARAGRATVATGRARAKAAGTVRLALRLTPAGRRRLRAGHRVTLKLLVAQGASSSALTVEVTR